MGVGFQVRMHGTMRFSMDVRPFPYCVRSMDLRLLSGDNAVFRCACMGTMRFSGVHAWGQCVFVQGVWESVKRPL